MTLETLEPISLNLTVSVIPAIVGFSLLPTRPALRTLRRTQVRSSID